MYWVIVAVISVLAGVGVAYLEGTNTPPSVFYSVGVLVMGSLWVLNRVFLYYGLI